MAMHVQDTISSQLDQLEDLQVKAVAFAVQAEQEGEDDARLCEMFPRAEWPQFYPPPPYVPEWQPCQEDDCDTLSLYPLCDAHYEAGLAALSPRGRAFIMGLPPPPRTPPRTEEPAVWQSVDDWLDALEGAGRTTKRVRGGWMAQCPAHDDRSPSLSIRDGNDGTALIHCFAGCDYVDIRRELGFHRPVEPARPAPRPVKPSREYLGEEVQAGHAQEREDAPAVDPAAAFWDACIVVEDDGEGNDTPALLETTDGRTLLPALHSNSIIGHAGSGKSWLLLDVIRNAIEKGGRVVYADFEETKQTLLRRARVMDMEECVINIGRMRYVTNAFFDPDLAGARLGAKRWLLNDDDHDDDVNPTYSVLIIDTMESASCPSDGADIAPWWASHVEDWLPTKEGLPGVAVVMADHPPKRKDENVAVEAGIGSTHKTSKLSGVGLTLTGGVTWTPKADGNKNMKVAKDRHGFTLTAQGKIAAKAFGRVRVMPDGKRVLQFSYEPSDTETDAAEGDNVEDRILAAINEAGPQGIRTSKNVYELAGVNWKKAGDALKRLQNRGYIHASLDGRANIYAITPEGAQHLLTGGDSGAPEHNGELF